MKRLDNGNIRTYLDDDKKTGVSELQIIDPNNIAPTIMLAHKVKIIINK